MRELNLDRLRTLVTIVDLGSFAAAAQALHLSPPTVSLHVSELEARLDAPLLLRERRRVLATGIGATLIERARLLLNQSDAMLEDVRRQVLGKSGRVRVSASTPVIAELMPAVLARLGQERAGIDVELAVSTSQEAIAGVAEGSVDIAVVALPQPIVANVRVQAWRSDPVMAFMPVSWERPARATPAWLASRPLILNDSRTRLSRLTTEWFAAAGHQPRPRIIHNYNESILSLVANGYGAALLASLQPSRATSLPHDARIAILPLKPALWRPIGIAHRHDVEAAVRHVLDALRGLPGRRKSL